MKPWELLAEASTPDGTLLTLTRRDTELVIMAGGKILMSSRMHGSEEAMAEMAFKRLGRNSPGVGGRPALGGACVLVGGLGLGYTLRATLDLLPSDATVVVAELIPAIVDWHRGPLAALADRPTEDPRVQIDVTDVIATLRSSPGRFDAILLDIDNGPEAFTESSNAGLYHDRGIAAIRAALKPGGVLAVWSAWEDRRFEQRLKYAGFKVTVERVRARLKRGGPRHTIFLGQATI
ncbi:MAG: MnmC family methyltransferase [Acidobacteriota bacterium]|nr:MnmC family methyltransferase [Acidobacteriota bacterium]